MARTASGTRTVSGERGAASFYSSGSGGDAYLLIETGDSLLLETGDRIVLDGIGGQGGGGSTEYRSIVASVRSAVI